MRSKFGLGVVLTGFAWLVGCSSETAKETAEAEPVPSVAVEHQAPPAPNVDAAAVSPVSTPDLPVAAPLRSSPANAAVSSTASTNPLPEPSPPRPFSPEDGSFEVLFPGEPEIGREELADGLAMITYRSASGGLERQIDAFDLPDALTPESALATLEAVADSLVESVAGEAATRTTLGGVGYPALRYDYVYEVGGERFRTAGVLAIAGPRQYQASVLSPASAWDEGAAEAFLASFRPATEAPLVPARSAEANAEKAPSPPSGVSAMPAAAETPAAEGVERRLPWVSATVRFPGEPEELSDPAVSDSDRLFHAFDGALSFTVTLHREEEALPREIAVEALAATAEAIAQSVGGEIEANEAVLNDRFADRRLAYRYVDETSGPTLVRQRLIYVDAVQVYLIVTGPADGYDADAAERFLDSWRLAENVADSAAADASR